MRNSGGPRLRSPSDPTVDPFINVDLDSDEDPNLQWLLHSRSDQNDYNQFEPKPFGTEEVEEFQAAISADRAESAARRFFTNKLSHTCVKGSYCYHAFIAAASAIRNKGNTELIEARSQLTNGALARFNDQNLPLEGMANLESLLSSAGLRFNRLTDDINLMSTYMHDIRICFIALTILIYCVLIGYFVHLCLVKKKRGGNTRRPRPQWDFQGETNQSSDYRNNQTGPLEDLVSVRSDGQVGAGLTTNTITNPPSGVGAAAPYIARNHRSAAPFMRHGRLMDHQFGRTTQATTGETTSLGGPNATTRLVTSEVDGTVVKHQIPHITTSEAPSYGQTNGPTTNNGEDDHKNGNNTSSHTAHGMPMRALHHRQMNHHLANENTEM